MGQLKRAGVAKDAEVARMRDYVTATAQRSAAAEAEVVLLKEGKAKDDREKEELRQERQELWEEWWKSAEDYRCLPEVSHLWSSLVPCSGVL